MSFFKKVKSFFGGDAPKISFLKLEDSIPVTDTGVKYRIAVTAESPLTVISVTGTLKAVYKDKEGTEEELLLAEDTDDGKHWIASQQPFPGLLDKGKTWNYSGSVFMEKKENHQLQNLFEQRNRYNLKVILTVELDIKETGMLFDPSVEREIRIY